MRAACCADQAADGTIRILDVGCGPLTTLGKVWEGHSIEITAVDPLAKGYEAIMKSSDSYRPCRWSRGPAKTPASLFPPDWFDYVHCENARWTTVTTRRPSLPT